MSNVNILKDMLLIDEPSITRLYSEMIQIAKSFLPPFFTLAITLEFIGNMDFLGVVKKLLIVSVLLSSFYVIHTTAVDISFDQAYATLKKVSPRNLFVKKWYDVKVRTNKNAGSNFIDKIAIPNLNDLLGTAFFLLAKVFIWVLKLIYSTVYHFTYVFSGIMALMYFFGWTQKALIGAIQSTLWCMVMPFIIVAILALVGNSIDERAINGELAIADMETIIWLFGITLLLLVSPLIALGMVRGEGIAQAGPRIADFTIGHGMRVIRTIPTLPTHTKVLQYRAKRIYEKGKSFVSGMSSPESRPNGKGSSSFNKTSNRRDK